MCYALKIWVVQVIFYHNVLLERPKPLLLFSSPSFCRCGPQSRHSMMNAPHRFSRYEPAALSFTVWLWERWPKFLKLGSWTLSVQMSYWTIFLVHDRSQPYYGYPSLPAWGRMWLTPPHDPVIASQGPKCSSILQRNHRHIPTRPHSSCRRAPSNTHTPNLTADIFAWLKPERTKFQTSFLVAAHIPPEALDDRDH